MMIETAIWTAGLVVLPPGYFMVLIVLRLLVAIGVAVYRRISHA